MKRIRKDKWAVYGEHGGTFTNLLEAKKCACEASKIDSEAEIYLIEDGCYYFKYVNGKLTYNGWDKKVNAFPLKAYKKDNR